MMRRQRHTWGGTSIADEESNTLAWVAAAVGVGVLIVIVFGLRSGDKESDELPPPGDQVAEDSSEQDVASPDERPIQVPPPEPTANENRAEVAAELASELQARRLWSEVEVEPGSDVMVIRSAYCEDAELKSSIQTMAGRMAAEGVRKIACYERHGSLVFERGL